MPQVMVENDALAVHPGKMSALRESFAFFLQGRFPFLEIPLCLENGHEVFFIALDQEKEGCQPIHGFPPPHDLFQFLSRQVFIEQGHVVAEVQVGFLPIVLGQGPPPDMVNRGLGVEHDFVAEVLHPPTEVDFFHVGEEVFVQSSVFEEQIRPHEKGGPGGPENLAFLVVLAVVFFQLFEQASPAERISPGIEEASGSSGVFESFFLVEGTDFRLGGGHLGVGFHFFNDGFHPAGRDFDV